MAKRMFALQKPDPVKRNRSELDCVWAPSIGEDVNTRVPAGVLLPVSSSHGPARQAQPPDQGDAAVWGRSRPRRGHGNSLIFFFLLFFIGLSMLLSCCLMFSTGSFGLTQPPRLLSVIGSLDSAGSSQAGRSEPSKVLFGNFPRGRSLALISNATTTFPVLMYVFALPVIYSHPPRLPCQVSLIYASQTGRD